MKKIETLRTTLRRLQTSDYENMRVLESNPLVMKFTSYVNVRTPEQTKKTLEDQVAKQPTLEPFGVWAAELKDARKFLGWFMLKSQENGELEIGYMIVQELWNQGYTTEVAAALVEYAIEKKPNVKLIARTNVENLPSIRILEKTGFRLREVATIPDKSSANLIHLKIFER